MPTHTTPWGWLLAGVAFGLLMVVVACQLHDSNQATAQAAESPPESVPGGAPLIPFPPEGKADARVPEATLTPVGAATQPLPPLRDAGPPAVQGPLIRSIISGPESLAPMPKTGWPHVTETTEPTPALPSSESEPLKSPPPVPTPMAVQMAPVPSPVEPLPAPALAPNPAVPALSDRSPMPVTTPIPTVVPAPVLTPLRAVVPLAPATSRQEPGEPPLAPQPGPIQLYHVRRGGETLADIARHTLGDAQRWEDIQKLNPTLQPTTNLSEGMVVRLPADACIPSEGVEAIQPLPSLRPATAPTKPKVVLPLTGTYVGNLDEKMAITLPKAIRDQLCGSTMVLVSPGPDHCLWLTNQAHLDRLETRLEQSPAREADIRVFKRLYFAQTEKVAVSAEGRVQISERLAQFAALHQEVVLVGIDDHFELWDVSRWRAYTQQKSAAARAAMTEGE